MSEHPEKDSVRDELLNESRALSARIKAQTEQAERLRDLAERIDSQTARDRIALEDMLGVLGESAQMVLDDLERRLGGQRLERVAIQLLQQRHGEEAELHYREWYDLLTDQGFAVNGKNPLQTFLTQLNRSAQIEPVGKRSGRYRLRLVA
ncbi:MAG: hypothetical protein QOI31_1754 [Solirubrobacterales bacterium]|jgi:predicted AAA+ superfamily ATPase|nr:hypothetical protein [Solirubrobacterales bacterium]